MEATKLSQSAYYVDAAPECIALITQAQHSKQCEFSFTDKTVEEIPKQIGTLIETQAVRFTNTQVMCGRVPKELFRLQNLRILDLSNTQIEQFPGRVGNLELLRDLNLSRNRLTEIPSQIGSIQTLEKLVLDNNQLARLPSTIGRLIGIGPHFASDRTFRGELSVRGNPLLSPFAEFVDRPMALLAYLRSLLPVEEKVDPKYFDIMLSTCEGTITMAETEKLFDFLEHNPPEQIELYRETARKVMVMNSAVRYLVPPPNFVRVITEAGMRQAQAKSLNDFMIQLTRPEIQGWLIKKGAQRKNWKKRYFVLQFGHIFYFQHPDDYEPKGKIHLTDVNEVCEDSSKENKKFGFKIVTAKRTYHVHSAKSAKERDSWIEGITRLVHVSKQAREVAGFLRHASDARAQAVWHGCFSRTDEVIPSLSRLECLKRIERQEQDHRDPASSSQQGSSVAGSFSSFTFHYRLFSLPLELFKMVYITQLDLSGNLLSFVPPEASELVNLRYVNLARNVFCEVPPVVCHLRSVTNLILSENLLCELPAEIGNLTNLVHFCLENNHLKCLVPEIGLLESLETINVSTNELFELPEELMLCSALEELLLGENLFTEVPKWICRLSKLRVLSFARNKIGALPSELQYCPDLTDVKIERNPLSKPWLDVAGNWDKLVRLVKGGDAKPLESFPIPAAPAVPVMPVVPRPYFGPQLPHIEAKLMEKWKEECEIVSMEKVEHNARIEKEKKEEEVLMEESMSGWMMGPTAPLEEITKTEESPDRKEGLEDGSAWGTQAAPADPPSEAAAKGTEPIGGQPLESATQAEPAS